MRHLDGAGSDGTPAATGPRRVSAVGATPYDLPVRGPAYQRPAPDLIERLGQVSSATASATLHKMGIRRTFLRGPRSLRAGDMAVGAARTLQFMPQREDVASGDAQEYAERESALWAVFEAAEPGDMLIIQANGDPHTGCVGEMLASSLAGRGGTGIVVDGCVRDVPKIKRIGLPVWSLGATPNYASQAGQFPWAYDVPINCGGALVLPGDIVIADDDGAVVVPLALAEDLLERSQVVNDWETFARMRIDAGGALSRYYPLDDEAAAEYEDWRRE